MSPESSPSRSHLLLIPSYNSGPLLLTTVRDALQYWRPVWVVIDGSTDESQKGLNELGHSSSELQVIKLPQNQGKGAAVLEGMKRALAQGFQFALLMDADGQHPPDYIERTMQLSQDNPDSMILGSPVFGPDAPKSRRYGRLIGNWWANLETCWAGIGDSLFGFRVYPIAKSVQILESVRGGRRFDFETQLAVRLVWAGVRPISVPVPVRYFNRQEGGVSHFQYVRDNLLLTRVHAWLVLQTPWRMMRLWVRHKGVE
jgi:glycosyltransferase involved in cell wall biosynthesis